MVYSEAQQSFIYNIKICVGQKRRQNKTKMAKQIPPPPPPEEKKRKQNKYPESQETYYDTLVLSWAKHQTQIRSPVCAACCEPSTRYRYAHLFVQHVVSQVPDTDTLTCFCSMLRARHQTQTCSPVCAACPWCELSAGCCDSAHPPDPDTQSISLTLTNTIILRQMDTPSLPKSSDTSSEQNALQHSHSQGGGMTTWCWHASTKTLFNILIPLTHRP